MGRHRSLSKDAGVLFWCLPNSQGQGTGVPTLVLPFSGCNWLASCFARLLWRIHRSYHPLSISYLSPIFCGRKEGGREVGRKGEREGGKGEGEERERERKRKEGRKEERTGGRTDGRTDGLGRKRKASPYSQLKLTEQYCPATTVMLLCRESKQKHLYTHFSQIPQPNIKQMGTFYMTVHWWIHTHKLTMAKRFP